MRKVVCNQNRNMMSEPDSILPPPKMTLFRAHDMQLDSRGTQCVGAGMDNIGNTCYLNSTLQALFHVPAFSNWLSSNKSHMSNCTVLKGECMICAMYKTFKASQKESGTVIKPFHIYEKLKFISKDLVYGRQEDAHEFMRYLLESIEKSYLESYKDKLDSCNKENTPLNQMFGGRIRTEVTCLQCGGVSTTYQLCQDMLLDIQHASTLDDALAAYFSIERLDGDVYHCERCHKKVSATKTFSLETPPEVLCIQLKRFGFFGEKINKHVSFPVRLDLTRFLCPESAHHGNVPVTYHLVSMVTHVGSSAHYGHYTAVAQTSTGHYYLFDDTLVRPISLSGVLHTKAYIMVYEREPNVPSVPQKSVVPAAATTTTCSINEQMISLSPQGPVKKKITSVANHKQGYDCNPAVYASDSSLPSAKDGDRVVFGLHQPVVSPTPPRLVLHINNDTVHCTPPQSSPQRQEQNVSVTVLCHSVTLVKESEVYETRSHHRRARRRRAALKKLANPPNSPGLCLSIEKLQQAALRESTSLRARTFLPV
jgi:ubiquitin carboxyl-terminal hydrolase 36/42